MYYIFNKNGNCIASCDGKPNINDLATRGENVQECSEVLDITRIQLVDGEIVMKSE